MTTIAELLVADDPASWRAVGFDVDEAGVCQVGTVRVRLDPSAGDQGVVAWTVAADDPVEGDIDGLATASVEPPDELPGAGRHPIGARSIDHLVVTTPDLDRTVAAITRQLGLPLKRTRDGEAYGRPVRQAFFRMGEVVLEVVGPPEPAAGDEGPATFFGLAVTVDSLAAAGELLGPERMGEPKPAVQPGRHITTIRSAAGLRVAVALMSPERSA